VTSQHPAASDNLTLVFITVTPTTPAAREGLVAALEALPRRGEHISIAWDAQGMSVELGCEDDELLERVIDWLKREFGVTAMVSRPRVDVRRTNVEHASGVVQVDTEPWMDAEVSTRPFYVSRLRQAFPRLQPMARTGGDEGTTVTLACRAPLVELFGFRQSVRQMTHGEAHASMLFDGYAPRDDDDDEPGALVRKSR